MSVLRCINSFESNGGKKVTMFDAEVLFGVDIPDLK